MSADEPDLLDLLSGEVDRREARAVRLAAYQALRAVCPDGRHLEPGQTWCGRCGQTVRAFEMVNNHDLGYLGCPAQFDPTWSRYQPAPGFREVANYPGRGHLTEEDYSDRWDRQFVPDCECGHPWGVHRHGEFCTAWCGCTAYDQAEPPPFVELTLAALEALGVDMPLGDMCRPVNQSRGYRPSTHRIRTTLAKGVYL
uniref:Uncharacterized protein n=1 Tax=Mycobacterium phage JustASigh TaxID=3158894 RepID=A0AAU8GM29_9CAUD